MPVPVVNQYDRLVSSMVAEDKTPWFRKPNLRKLYLLFIGSVLCIEVRETALRLFNCHNILMCSSSFFFRRQPLAMMHPWVRFLGRRRERQAEPNAAGTQWVASDSTLASVL